MRPQFEMAQIIRGYGENYTQNNEVLKYHIRVLNALKMCRTAELGGHLDRCDSCSHERISYNSFEIVYFNFQNNCTFSRKFEVERSTVCLISSSILFTFPFF